MQGDEHAHRDALDAARDWLASAPRVALATVVATWGSSPVPIGGQMAVGPGERFAGSVSGGCVENEVILAGADVIDTGEPQTLSFGVSNETAWAKGLPCGGEISVLIVPLDAAALPKLDLIADARATRQGVRVILDARTGALETTLIADQAGLSEFDAITQTDGRISLPMLPPPRVLVIGATHIAQHLVAMLDLVGYDTTVIDPRTAYATKERFGETSLVTEWPQDALPKIGVDAFTAVVALAHVPEIDDAALKVAAASTCFYVGALGSTRNHDRRKERLRTAGLDEAAISRIQAPIGLDIGAYGPAEIAASILGELILAYRGAKKPRTTTR